MEAAVEREYMPAAVRKVDIRYYGGTGSAVTGGPKI
jgi:hypothetical protein